MCVRCALSAPPCSTDRGSFVARERTDWCAVALGRGSSREGRQACVVSKAYAAARAWHVRAVCMAGTTIHAAQLPYVERDCRWPATATAAGLCTALCLHACTRAHTRQHTSSHAQLGLCAPGCAGRTHAP